MKFFAIKSENPTTYTVDSQFAMGDLPVNQNEHPVSKRYHSGRYPTLHASDLNPLNMSAEDAEVTTNSLLYQFEEIMRICVSRMLGCFSEGTKETMLQEAHEQLISSAETAVDLIDTVYPTDIKERHALLNREERHYIFTHACETLLHTMEGKIMSCISVLRRQNEGCLRMANELSQHYNCDAIIGRLNTSTSALNAFSAGAELFATEWMRVFLHHYVTSLD